MHLNQEMVFLFCMKQCWKAVVKDWTSGSY